MARALVILGLCLLSGCGIDSGDAPGPDTGVEEWPAHAFEQALAPRRFTFPEDHGPHPDFRDEWWYVTGNLWDADRNRYGFQLTLFRRALQPNRDVAALDAALPDTSARDAVTAGASTPGAPTPGASTPGAPTPDGSMQGASMQDASLPDVSKWDVSTPDVSTPDVSTLGQTYMGHFAITDVGGGRFLHSERFGRPLAGIAGSGHAPARVWLDDWRLEWRQGHWWMSARHGSWALELRLEPAFAPILQGDAGYSRKNAQAGNASFYYSQPRLRASGTLERPLSEDSAAQPLDQSGDSPSHRSISPTGQDSNPSGRHRIYTVDGLAWLDREWGSSQLAPEQQGWDWFALQLDDGRALMIYQLRDRDGRADPYSAGSLISADGRKQPLDHRDFILRPLAYWDSPQGVRIPIQWQLRIPAQGIDWRVAAVQPAQYLDGVFPYWEGAVDVTADSDTIGVGYLEMTGYDDR